MVKKLVLCLLFFLISPVALLAPIYYLGYIDGGRVLGETVSFETNTRKLLAPAQNENGIMAATIISQNSTSVIIEKYLEHYQSPLLPYKDEIVEIAKKYSVSPQLIVAIAQQESNLGKTSPENCFNAWGWGIHAQGTTCFNNWSEAVETVIKGIANNYCSKGYCDDPCVMMRKYTPRSNGSWCAGVNQFLAEMESGDF